MFPNAAWKSKVIANLRPKVPHKAVSWIWDVRGKEKKHVKNQLRQRVLE